MKEVTEEWIDDWAETFVDSHSYEGKEISEIKELLKQMLKEVGVGVVKMASKEKKAKDWDNARDAYGGYREDK